MPLDAMFGRQLELKKCQTFEINEFWTANAMMNDSFFPPNTTSWTPARLRNQPGDMRNLHMDANANFN
jgi:hypothetical protein